MSTDPSNPARDDLITLYTGLGHTDSTPFAENTWWAFRENRILAGTIEYEKRPIYWRREMHANYPTTFKRAVWTLLLINHRRDMFSNDVLQRIISFCGIHWFMTKEFERPPQQPSKAQLFPGRDGPSFRDHEFMEVDDEVDNEDSGEEF